MKRFFSLALVLFACILPVSCDPENGGGGNGDNTIPKLGVEVMNAQALYEVPQNQTVSLNLAVSADPRSLEAYTITLVANPTFVAAYNLLNGTDYQMLPASAYSFSSNSVILTRYGQKSSYCELRVGGNGCEVNKTYLLPVVIDAVTGGTKYEAPDENAAFILVKVLPSAVNGTGTESDPFIINDVETFLKVNSLLKEDMTLYFKMTADVDFTGITLTQKDEEEELEEGEIRWTPINYVAAVGEDEGASAAADAIAVRRKIVFDGNGHKISNLTCDGSLIARLVGSVKNLTLENIHMECEKANQGGILVGTAGTEDTASEVIASNIVVKDCSIINDYKRTGGIIGYLKAGIVENCEAQCNVIGAQQCGGLIGRVDAGTVKDCSASGSVTLAQYYGGGLIGVLVKATVKDCHAGGNVVHTSGSYSRIGGLIGQIDDSSTVERCYATGDMLGTGHFGGGLIGVISSATLDKDNKVYADVDVNISECYSIGSVSLPTEGGNWAHGGGLLGSISTSLNSTVTISNCFCTGAVTVRRYSGGFVGSVYDKTRACKQLNITNSYTTSDITGIYLPGYCGLVLGLNDGINAATPNVISCKGFVAWNTSDRAFSFNDCVPVAGNYCGTEGSVSQQAKALGWDESIWDLSGTLPALKNIK